MPVTREQAIALIQENQSGEGFGYASEIRIVRLEFGTIPEFFRFHDEQVSLQAEGWICDYEHRDRHEYGPSAGQWSAWKMRRCYVVTPEPTPFVVVDESSC
jgi:hypothetical protein